MRVCTTLRRSAVAITLAMTTFLTPTTSAFAVSIGHGSIASDNPAGFTPEIMNGRVNALLVMGSRVFVGGTFSTVQQAGGGSNQTRNYLMAFNVNTGVIDPGFRPNLNGAVEALAPAADGQSVYVGGGFGSVNGSSTFRRLVRLNPSNGATMTPFASSPNAKVTDLVMRNGQLYASGEFTSIGGASRSGLARLDPTTGVADPSLNIPFTNPWKNDLVVWRIDVTPDGSRLIAAGTFQTVNGQARDQIAMVNVGTSPASLINWSTDFFRFTIPSDPTRAWCASIFPHYIRDMDISPDGSYIAIVTTGANAPGHPSCDSMSRWPMDTDGPGQQPDWVANTGGDSFHSVLATGAAIYGGGHQQWVNNPYNPNRCGVCDGPYPGGIVRTGFSGHDPQNGLPFTWNAPRNPRGKGVLAMVSTANGFFFGSNTNKVSGETHHRVGFMPLAGGYPLPVNYEATLPGFLYTIESDGDLVKRTFDGATLGAPATVAAATDWKPVRGVFSLDDRLYTGMNDGTFTTRTFDGSTAGSIATINLHGLDIAPSTFFSIPGTSEPVPSLATHLANNTGMVFHDGWMYYTVQGDGRLFKRGFASESRTVGAPLLVASTGDGVDWANVRGMTLASGTLYFALADGTLNAVAWGTGHPTGSVSQIAGPGMDGVDYSGRGMFVFGA